VVSGLLPNPYSKAESLLPNPYSKAESLASRSCFFQEAEKQQDVCTFFLSFVGGESEV
jgi:hypothetical protein